MASPEVKTTKEEGNIPMQSYYNTFNQQTEEAATGIIEEAAADIIEQDSGVTYFVDEEGCYYYQLDSDDLNLVSLPTGEIEESDEVILNEESHVLVDSEAFQTVTLVPSETGIGQISSVLVVQEESKTIVNLDIKVEHKEDPNEDTNIFQAEEEKVAPAGLYDDSVKKEYSPGNNKSKCNLSYFTCNFCPYSSRRRYLLMRHMKSHSGERLHKCSVCERRFKSRATLQNHVNAHKGVKPHVCKYCDSPFTTSGELSRHVRYKHTHEKPYKCTECDYASVESSKLRRHIRCHTGERPYKCPHCTYASVDNFKLKRHLRTHTGEKPYRCEYCNLCFTQSNSLKAHKQIHNVTEKPVYACELCPARCRRKTDLRIHIQRLHTSNTPYKCKICGKLSPDLYSSKLHNKTHRGEKCFKCHLCAYASTTPRRLRSHMLKHTDEKPFICEQCDQSFRQKQLLRRHQNLYHNPCYVPNPPKEKTHICHECNRSFAYNGNLIRHLAVHHLELEHQDRILSLKLDRPNEELDDVDKVDSDDEENNNVMIRVCDKEMKRAGFMTVSNEDGRKYLVFEIIHLENGP